MKFLYKKIIVLLFGLMISVDLFSMQMLIKKSTDKILEITPDACANMVFPLELTEDACIQSEYPSLHIKADLNNAGTKIAVRQYAGKNPDARHNLSIHDLTTYDVLRRKPREVFSISDLTTSTWLDSHTISFIKEGQSASQSVVLDTNLGNADQLESSKQTNKTYNFDIVGGKEATQIYDTYTKKHIAMVNGAYHFLNTHVKKLLTLNQCKILMYDLSVLEDARIRDMVQSTRVPSLSHLCFFSLAQQKKDTHDVVSLPSIAQEEAAQSSQNMNATYCVLEKTLHDLHPKVRKSLIDRHNIKLA